MAIFSFKSKKGEVLNHWIAFTEGFSHSPQEFYGTLEQELTARNIPGMKLSRVEFAEGGLLSEQRLYLRMIREHLAFDVCAAPFGKGYFFSCRTVHFPAIVRLWQLLLLSLLLGIFYFAFARLLGVTFAAVAVVTLFIAVALSLRNASVMGLPDLESVLIQSPVLGPIYECWFRRETYFREDSRLVYLEAVPKLVKELAEQTVAAKGVKLVEQYQRAPVLGELYKRVSPAREPSAA